VIQLLSALEGEPYPLEVVVFRGFMTVGGFSMREGIKSVGVALTGLLLGASLVSTAEIPVTLSLADGGQEPVAAMLRASMPDKPQQGEASVAVVVPGRDTFNAGAGSVWKLRLEAEGHWGPESLFTVESGRPIELVLYPAGTLTGKLSMPRGDALPKEISARFEQAAGAKAARRIPQGIVQCPVTGDEFRCAVPAGKLDVRLRAKGYVSHFRWALDVPRAKTVALGTLELRPGGSVVGRVEAPGGEVQGTRVEVVPLQASHAAGPAEEVKQERLALSGEADARGFFHLVGVPPGMYRVVARSPNLGETVHEPVQVMLNVETEVRERLVLKKPSMLEVSVTPRVDPLGKPWRIELMEINTARSAFRPAGHGVLSEEGTWRKSGIPQGRYTLFIKDADGSRWLSEEIEVGGGREAVHRTLDAVTVDGTVTLAGDPLAATLWFGGRHGPRNIRMLTDEQGAFTGVLPAAGPWNVEVESLDPQFSRLVEVEVSSEGRVEIDLPNRKVQGEVVDAETRKPAHTVVILTKTDERRPPSQARTDDKGAFSFLGLAEGGYVLQAFSGDGMRSSAPHQVEIGREREPAPVTLELRGKRSLAGRVVTAQGPVPGARVSGYPSAGGVPSSNVALAAQTDVEGRFELSVPTDADEIQLTVMPPGFALKATRVRLPSETPVTIPVHQEGGSLTVKLGNENRTSPDALARLQVNVDGLPLDTGAFMTWMRVYGGGDAEPGTLRIPMMEFGSYRVCQETRCSEGYLPPLGELTLTLPAK
jgi:hypothetical protein